MKFFATSALLVASVGAESQGYGTTAAPAYKPAPPVYGPPGPAGPGGYAPYPEQPYRPYGHTPDYVPLTMPSLVEPYPFTKFEKDTEEEKLSLPHLGDYHCFLTGAPWTSCGRRSLTSYFLDQCMTFHHLMTKNVQGICKVPEPVKAPKVDKYSVKNEYEAYEEPTEAATEAYTGTGYGGAISQDYLKEKCLQNAFVSITTATVMCLTENMIRIKYIEHYAANAATNPVEGPILYLKKLHAFIGEVLECTGDAAKTNYPNLWLTFKSQGHVKYNPNAPFVQHADGSVGYDRLTNGRAAGIESYTVNDKFLCADTEDLEPAAGHAQGWSQYASLPHNHHYDPSRADSCTTSDALSAIGSDKMIRYCSASEETQGQYVVDLDLQSLYDSVHYTEASITDLRRPQTIAEIAVSNAGVLEQPLLDGFGIMYFCAFHACKANNGGDLDGTCFPEFDAEEDWAINTQHKDYTDFKANSETIEYCLKKKFLTPHNIAENGEVQEFKELLQRSHVCLTESISVSFLDTIYPGWESKDDAVTWVYGRHLADEKCYEDDSDNSLCATDTELYSKLYYSLESLVSECDSNKSEYYAKKAQHAAQYKQQQKPAYAPPQPAYAPTQGYAAPAPQGYYN